MKTKLNIEIFIKSLEVDERWITIEYEVVTKKYNPLLEGVKTFSGELHQDHSWEDYEALKRSLQKEGAYEMVLEEVAYEII